MSKGDQGKIRDLVRNELKRLHGEVRWNNNHVFSPDTKNASDVTEYLSGQARVYENLKELTDYKIQNVPIVKKVVTKSPALQHIELIDLKLNVFGPIEDQVYAAFPVLIKNIRRGNTVLRYADKGQAKYTFGRKGLEKFFDMRFEHISPKERYDDKCLTDETHMHKNYILGGPLKTILEGNEVEVIKTLKANGENVQVSWNSDVESWIVCSKNVGLVAKSRSDVAQYAAVDRFGFAKEMAHVWFDTIEKMDADTLKQLKSDLDGNTLIGEYIGSNEHQHLVKYSRVTIIFYAVVSNNSEEDCWPCDQAWNLFAKYGLDKVHAISLGKFSNYDLMADCLCKTFQDVAKSEIAKDEEGNVLYFIKRTKDGKNDKVLSLAKLKTLEYRLFRKMREKLRNFYAVSRESSSTKSEIIKKFVREAKELLQEHDLPRPIDYYIQLFTCAFDFIDSDHNTNADLLHKEYVTFSEKLLTYFSQKTESKEFQN